MRHQDWTSRLSAAIAAARQKPFVWGSHDCCLFAADVVRELTGVDHAAGLRGTYSTALEAARVLKPRGGVRGVATAALGPAINPKLAQRGDVVMVGTDHGEALAVCIGSSCVAPSLGGLEIVPMTKALAAWRVA